MKLSPPTSTSTAVGRANRQRLPLAPTVWNHEQAISRFSNTLSHYISLGIGEKAIRLAAQKSFDVFVPLYEGKRTVLVATSMSAAVLARMEEINQDAGKPLDIVGRVLYAAVSRTSRKGPRRSARPVCDPFGS